ncbi:MAG: hypothetical protein ABSE18_01450 [Minisyncoccia bacterium]
MTVANLMKQAEKVRITQVGKKRIATMPAKIWEEIEDCLEELAWSQSPRFIAKIKQAREDIKKGRYATLEEVRSRLLKK